MSKKPRRAGEAYIEVTANATERGLEVTIKNDSYVWLNLSYKKDDLRLREGDTVTIEFPIKLKVEV